MGIDKKIFMAYDGTPISYIELGEGPVVIFAHGFGGNAAEQLPLFEQLKDSMCCISWDQRGYGDTPAVGDIGMPQSAQDVKNLIETLELEDVTFVGYSMGGAVLFSYIQQFGVEHLKNVIIQDMSPKPLNDDMWNLGAHQGWYKQLNYDRDLELMATNYREFITYFTLLAYTKSTPDQPRSFGYKSGMEKQLKEVSGFNDAILNLVLNIPKEQEKSNIMYWKSAVSADNREVLKKITVPTALMYGDPGSIYDPCVADYMAERIPGPVTKFSYKDCTHLFRVEKMAECVADMKEFVKNT